MVAWGQALLDLLHSPLNVFVFFFHFTMFFGFPTSEPGSRLVEWSRVTNKTYKNILETQFTFLCVTNVKGTILSSKETKLPVPSITESVDSLFETKYVIFRYLFIIVYYYLFYSTEG